MRWNTNLLFCLSLLLLAGCYSALDDPLQDRAGFTAELVVYGIITTNGGTLSISKTVAPDAPYFDSDLSVGATAVATLIDQQDTSQVHQFAYEANTDAYHLQASLDPTTVYRLRIIAEGLPTIWSQPLAFAPPFRGADVDFQRREDSPATDVVVTTRFPPDTYHLVRPLSEDNSSDVNRAPPFLYTDFNDLFLGQCGIVNESADIAYASVCFSDTSASVAMVHEFSRFDALDPFSQIGTAPDRIGVSVMSITNQDYLFFRSLRRNQNLLEDYLLSREPLTLTNMTGGYGYVVLARGQEYWIDL